MKGYIENNIEIVKELIEIDNKIMDEKIDLSHLIKNADLKSNLKLKNSIIYYENTYMPNTGVIYKGESKFDCLAIYEGEVVKLEEDEIMGTIVTIKHDENIMSIYGSLQNVKVKEGDIVNKMDVIGEAGKNNLSSSLGEHLHFELIVNGKNVDPEKNYGKTLVELNK